MSGLQLDERSYKTSSRKWPFESPLPPRQQYLNYISHKKNNYLHHPPPLHPLPPFPKWWRHMWTIPCCINGGERMRKTNIQNLGYFLFHNTWLCHKTSTYKFLKTITVFAWCWNLPTSSCFFILKQFCIKALKRCEIMWSYIILYDHIIILLILSMGSFTH